MAESPQAPPIPAENSFLKAIRQPRFLLILLAVWAIIGALTEFFTSSGLFVDLHGRELDGALGGRSLSWEAIPLAILYLYAARDPKRYHPVFWLALVEQGVAILANVYHWSAGDFSFESVAAPIGVAAALGLLVFLHLFQTRPAPTGPSPSAAGGASGL